MKILCALLLFAASLPAYATNPKLTVILEQLRKRGDELGGNGRGFRHRLPGATSSHYQVEHFQIFPGAPGWAPVQANLEDWTRDENGNWARDEWSWFADLDGNLTDVWHEIYVFPPDNGTPHGHDLPHGKPGDALEVQRWNGQIDHWYDLVTE